MNQTVPRPKDAIVTGPDTWIGHIDLSGRYRTAVKIDHLMPELASMWAALETQCMAGCCGVHAFDFSADGVAASLGKVNAARSCEALARLRNDLLALRGEVVSSNALNMNIDKSEFLELLSHFDKCYRAAIPSHRDKR
nr:DUF6331 family protein [Massilia genomosp. 1]